MSTREMRAEQLKIARVRIGDTQEVFAAKLELPLSTYRRYEQAASDIPLHIYAALAQRWHIDLNEMITGKKGVRGGSLPAELDDLTGPADKGLLEAIREGAQLGDPTNMDKLRVGIIKAIRYALDRDRRGLPL